MSRKRIKNICEVDGCKSYVVSHGLCDKHRLRLAHHGHLENTRPKDWGKRERHPLYNIWRGHKRYNTRHDLCKEWADDFWEFAKHITERPSKNHFIKPVDINSPIAINNWHWVETVLNQLNSEEKKTYLRNWAKEDRKRNPDKHKNRDLMRQYGIGIEDYRSMEAEQNGLCAICRKPESATNPKTKELRSLAVDHCHDTKKVRGLLCSMCNTAIGSFNDDISVIERSIKYLKKHSLAHSG